MAKKKMSDAGTALVEFGSSGLKRFGGYVQEEFLRELQGPKGMKVYREMRDNSAIVGACLGVIEMLIRQVPWHAEPFSQEKEDVERAEFVDTCRDDMSMTWAETIGEHLSMLPFGWAYHELVYKIRGGDVNDPTRRSKYADGRIGWRKIPLRAQDSLYQWEVDAAGGVQAMLQQASPDYRVRRIPIEKALHFRAKCEKNNPEGRSVLRNAYFSWYFSKNISTVEAIGIERDFTGLPVGWIPAECMMQDATPNDRATKEAMVSILRDLKRDEQEYILLPLQYDERGNKRFDITLMASPGRRQHDTSAVVERYDRRIAMTMAADFVLMGHEAVGSFALSSDKTALLGVACGGWLDLVTDIYNDYALPRLFALNGWPLDRMAKLKHGDIEAPNLAGIGDFVSKAYGAGFRWNADEGVDAHLRRVSGLPKRKPGQKLATPPEPTATPAPPAPPPPPEGKKKPPPATVEDDEDEEE